MTPKAQLYYLVNEYIKGNYDSNTFCDPFTIIYNIEVDYDELNETENRLFSELCKLTGRFSSFEEDLKIPNMYFTEQQVKEKVLQVKQELDHMNPS